MWGWILVYAIIVFLGFGVVKRYIVDAALNRKKSGGWEGYGIKDEAVILLMALTVAGTLSVVAGMYIFVGIKPGFCLRTPKELTESF